MKILTKKEYDEFVELHKNEERFAIYLIDKEKPEKIFWAKSREDAVKELQTFKKENPNVEAYYKLYGFYFVKTDDETGNMIICDNLNECFNKHITIKNKIYSFFNNLYMHIETFYYKFLGKITLIKNFFKDLIYWIKNYSLFECGSHNRIEWYSLDSHILNDIKFNVKILIDKMHGCPNCIIEEAKTYFKDEKFKDDVEAGMKLWKIRLTELLNNVYLYELYREYGCYNEKDEYSKMIYEKYKNTIPYYPESKDINYDEIYKLSRNQWVKICNWMIDYGENLWD